MTETIHSPAGQSIAAEADLILRTLRTLVEPLASLTPGECEVVLHDLRLLPNSIVAVAGDLSGRDEGGSATDLLLRASATDTYSTVLGYGGRNAYGREWRSSTIIFRDSAGTAVAALCVNNDTHAWRILAELAGSMMPQTRLADSGANEAEEFVGDVDEVAQHVLASAISVVDVPVDLMHKRHKLAVVQALRDRGFFMLKESVETAAQALGVTRFTVYNYLNEIEHETAPATDRVSSSDI
ncbi:hypothetical protein DCE93_01740 [Agromyces badenianii]|uniref:Uncharacterized protein n=2 Tax=Agromyces badenianii TaxID=2080742 RepID=A0A2S0WT91_9MICO|nr:PAS domain-containing protein [Agromyces badenianii]AWB94547.1 hypothetical protein DCE93_01740 [Agromyces badenianii]PWC03663.1 hypothetical protein DCE94_11690 [Agromyces badenianii]